MKFDDLEEEGEAVGWMSDRSACNQCEPSNAILADPLQAIQLVGRVVGQSGKKGRVVDGASVRELRKNWLAYLRNLEPIKIPDHIDFVRRAMALCDKMADRSLVSLLQGKTILGIGGQFSAGKSAFVNAVVGLKNLLPVEQNPTTSIPTFVTKGKQPQYLLTAMKGKVSQEISPVELEALSHAFYEKYKISFSAFVDSCIISSPDFKISPKIVLLDTPGFSKPDDLARTFTLSDRERALEQLKRADRLIWLIHQENGGIRAEDLEFIKDINPTQRILIVVTHADVVSESNMDAIIEKIKEMTVTLPGGVYGVTAYSAPLAREYRGKHVIADFLKDVASTDDRRGDIVHQFAQLEKQIAEKVEAVGAEMDVRIRELKKYIAKTTEIFAMQSLAILMEHAVTRQKRVRQALKAREVVEMERRALLKQILEGVEG